MRSLLKWVGNWAELFSYIQILVSILSISWYLNSICQSFQMSDGFLISNHINYIQLQKSFSLLLFLTTIMIKLVWNKYYLNHHGSERRIAKETKKVWPLPVSLDLWQLYKIKFRFFRIRLADFFSNRFWPAADYPGWRWAWYRTVIWGYNLSVKVSLMLDDPFQVPFLCNLKHINLYLFQNNMKLTSKYLLQSKPYF